MNSTSSDPSDPDARDGQPPDLGAAMPFAGLLGARSTRLEPDGLSAAMLWRPELSTTGGLLHGGALMAFADSVGAAAAFVRLPVGAATATVTSSTTFVAAVHSGELTARAFVEHVGSRFITVRTEIRRPDGRLAGLTVQTQAVMEPPAVDRCRCTTSRWRRSERGSPTRRRGIRTGSSPNTSRRPTP